MAQDIRFQIAADVKKALGNLQKLEKQVKESFGESSKAVAKSNKSLTLFSQGMKDAASNVKLAVKAFVALKVVGTISQFFSNASDEFINFEKALIGVGKTTGIAGDELRRLGQDITSLSLRIPESQQNLLGIAQAAGQLGVTGSENILNFAETIAKLGVASDLSGEEAATALTRILNVTGTSVDKIDELASVIVALGNNFAATEREITRVANEVARASGVFGVGSDQSAAFGAALRSLGVRAELAGTVIGKTFRAIQDSINEGGARFELLQEITGQTADQLRVNFQENATKVFQSFIKNISKVSDITGSTSKALEIFGLTGEGVNKVLPTLAQNSELLGKALTISNREFRENNALNKEAEEAYKSTAARTQVLNNRVAALQKTVGSKLSPAFLKLKKVALEEFVLPFASGIQAIALGIEKIFPKSEQIDRITELKEETAELIAGTFDLEQSLKGYTKEQIRANGTLSTAQGKLNALNDQIKRNENEIITLVEAKKREREETEAATAATNKNTKSSDENTEAKKSNATATAVAATNTNKLKSLVSVLGEDADKSTKKLQEYNKQLAQISANIADPIKFVFNTEELRAAIIDPLVDVFSDTGSFRNYFKGLADIGKEEFAQIGVGIFSAITEGKAGAKKIVSSAAQAIAGYFFGPMGSAIAKAVIEPLMMVPEEFAKRIIEFAETLPQIIENIFINIINWDEIANRASIAFTERIPFIVENLITALVTRFADPNFQARLSANLAVAVIGSVAELPAAIARGIRDGFNNSLAGAKEFTKKVFDVGSIIIQSIIKAFRGAGNLLKRIFKFEGGGRGAVEKFLGFDFPFIKFAQGGLVGGQAKVRGDSNLNDTIPALLSAGEAVIPRSVMNGTVGNLVGFLEKIGAPIGRYGLLDDAVNLVSGGAAFLGDLLQDTFGDLGETFVGVFDSVFEAKRFFGGVDPSTFFSETLKDPSNFINNVIEQGFGSLNEYFSDFGKLIGEELIPDEIIQIVKSLAQFGANLDPIEVLKDPKGAVSAALRSVIDVFKPYFMKTLNGGVPLANGGVIPSGFSNDTFPARLSSGEFVVNNSLTPKLEDFLNNGRSSSTDMSATNALLAQLVTNSEEPIMVESEISLNQSTFAELLLQLSRNNARVA